jgi:hypothetical protein
VQNIESEDNYSCKHVTYVSFPIIASGKSHKYFSMFGNINSLIVMENIIRLINKFTLNLIFTLNGKM